MPDCEKRYLKIKINKTLDYYSSIIASPFRHSLIPSGHGIAFVSQKDLTLP